MSILTALGPEQQLGAAAKVVAVDGAAALAAVGRRCPKCGAQALIGHGRRRRVCQLQPVRRGVERKITRSYRCRCKACRRTHTFLPAGLGPHKRYTLAFIEAALHELESGLPYARVSARFFGVSTRRLYAWHHHLAARGQDVRKAVESLVRRDPLFRLPAAMPGAGVLVLLAALMAVAPSGLFLAVNRLLSANGPLEESLLLHPPTSRRAPHVAWPSQRLGGVPFG